MCRREDKAMITPSHLNTNSVLSVEYKISKSPWLNLRLPDICISPDLMISSLLVTSVLLSMVASSLSSQRPISWRILLMWTQGYIKLMSLPPVICNNIIPLCSVYCIASIRGDILFRVLFTHLTVTKSDTFGSDAQFSYFRCKTFEICHNFPLLVIPETKLEKYERILSNLPARRKDRITRNSVLSE